MKTSYGVSISVDNGKLGGFIPSVSFPAVITCRAGAPCIGDCYACKGNYRFPCVKSSLQNNLDLYRYDKHRFFRSISDFLRNGLVTYKFFRWFAAGDIVDGDFLQGMVNTAVECPDTTFLAFTKKFELVNDFLSGGGVIPENLIIVFSAWDKSFSVPNPHGLPVSFVDFYDKARNPEIPASAFECGGKCPDCLHCWRLQNGGAVVFHQH